MLSWKRCARRVSLEHVLPEVMIIICLIIISFMHLIIYISIYIYIKFCFEGGEGVIVTYAQPVYKGSCNALGLLYCSSRRPGGKQGRGEEAT